MGARSAVPLGVLVADQHRIVRAGIKVLLSETGSWQRFAVGEAETTEEAIAMLACGGYPVVLMDYNLPGRGAIKATEMILSRWPSTSIIALTDTDDGAQAERILRTGARGCILRNIELDTLVGAIRTVITGRPFLSNEIAQNLLGRKAGSDRFSLHRLTAREKEVFLSILGGLRDKEIATKMGIAKRTVDKHRQHINFKFGTKTPLELLQAGLRMGLVKVE